MIIQEKMDWFNNNFMPVLRTSTRDCDSCVFRGLRHPYCISLSCWYLEDCKINTFYWISKYNMKYEIPEEVKDFFHNIKKEDIKDISRNLLKAAITKKTNCK